jgi:hypothetical protein
MFLPLVEHSNGTVRRIGALEEPIFEGMIKSVQMCINLQFICKSVVEVEDESCIIFLSTPKIFARLAGTIKIGSVRCDSEGFENFVITF